MTFFDFLKDLIDTTKERLKTPISGAFFFSFLICNWRPIFLLLFSKASIEDKIIVINHEYCKWGSILIPFLMALAYTIVVPMLSVIIDKILISTKKERFRSIYVTKGVEIDEKILFTKKENLLKDAESRNNETQDYLDEIKKLNSQIIQIKETNDQVAAADKNTINKLNLKLRELNRESSDMYEIVEGRDDQDYNREFFNKNAFKVFQRLTFEDKKLILNLRDSEGKINLNNIDPVMKNRLINLKLVVQLKSGEWVISDRGIYIYDRLIVEKGVDF